MAINEQIVLSARNQARAAFTQLESDARKTAGTLSNGFGAAGAGMQKFNTQFTGQFLGGLKAGKVTVSDFGEMMSKASQEVGLGTSQIARLTGATGIYSTRQMQAARVSAMGAAKSRELAQAVKDGTMTTREAGKAWGEWARQNEVAQGGIQGLIGNLPALASKLAVVTGVVVGVGAAVNKGLDFAAAGANLQRLEEAGTNLATGLDSSYDVLMDKLRQASLNTISNSELMLSANRAMMLGLGGDSEKLGQLMEVASFRGRAMGLSTSQAFSDIVTGIGRASPMILDNLGIVLDAEATYKRYAEQIGKSADELTKQEQTQALLNATIADGQRQIAAAGGLAADNATAFERWETASTNLADAWKMRLAPAGVSLANTLTANLTKQDELIGGMKFITMLVDGEVRAYQRMGGELIDQTDLYRQLRDEIESTARVEELRAEAASRASQATVDGKRTLEEYKEELSRTKTQAENAAQAMGDLMYTPVESARLISGLSVMNAQLADAKKKAEEAQRPIKNVLDLMSGELSSPIAGFIEDLKWFQAGGWRIQAAFEALKGGLESGAITPAEAEVWAGELYKATEDMQVELGKLNIDDAAANISSTLGITAEDAKTYILGTDGIQGALDQITGTEWIINVKVNYEGTLPPGLPPLTDPNRGNIPIRKPGKREKAAGGPIGRGWPYLVGEMGPEIFVPWTSGMILNNQQAQGFGAQGGGGGGSVTLYGDIVVMGGGEPGDVYAEVAMALQDQVSRSARAGAQYSGA